VNRRRGQLRKWRLRGRRGQVSAIATILGLLLVVTFIANYLTATLPNQMSVNDLNHVIQVENQVGRLQALLEDASSAGAVGAQLTQPITLGSVGIPPFAAANPATIEAATAGSSLVLNSSLATSTFAPPTGGIAGGIAAACVIVNTAALVSLSCPLVAHVTYNFSSTPTTGYSFSVLNGGTFNLNVTTSGVSTGAQESIAVATKGTAPMNLDIIGSNDSITLTMTTASVVNLVIDGNYDVLQITNSAVFSTVNVVEAGIHETTTITSAQDLTFLDSVYGGSDTFSAPTFGSTTNTATNVNVYYVGFTATSTSCPNDNVATTDTVSGGNLGTYAATYNVTTTYNPHFISHWTQTGNVVAASAQQCPFYNTVATQYVLGQSSAGFDVHLVNTYLPQADVAFDEGGVVFAQPGGTPVMIDGPSISAVQLADGNIGSMSIWIPVFTGSFATDSGVSTAEISTRLISLNTVTLSPSTALGAAQSSNITLTVTSPFAAAWANFFNSTAPFENFWNCTGPSSACNGPYSFGGPLGTVILAIPTATQLDYLTIQVATFAITLI
jgi:hypothetical protein